MNIPRIAKTAPSYLVVALFCVALNNCLLIGLDFFGIHYSISSLIAAALIIPISYFLHCNFTYGVKENRSNFTNYFLQQSLNVPATIFLIFLLHDILKFSVPLSVIILTGVMAFYNFFGSFLTIAINSPKNSIGNEK